MTDVLKTKVLILAGVAGEDDRPHFFFRAGEPG